MSGVLYPPDWRQRRRGANPHRSAIGLLMTVSSKVGREGGGHPVAVVPSKGAKGTVVQWDAYTSACDARALICLVTGGVPDAASGLETKPWLHDRDRVWLREDDEPRVANVPKLTSGEPVQLELFGAVA